MSYLIQEGELNSTLVTCQRCQETARRGAEVCLGCGATINAAILREQIINGLADTLELYDPLIGREIDSKYTIIERLGGGVTGAVYRAKRKLFGDEVAIKILHSEYATDVTAIERFRREARATLKLKNDNVVRILDYHGMSSGHSLAYIVMELLRGISLRTFLEGAGPLSIGQAVQLVLDICSGIGAAHQLSIVHRDLKPENCIVVPPSNMQEGEKVVVVDFGLARLCEQVDKNPLTQRGVVLGTPLYMSPEQCLGEDLGPTADVYSIGIMFYEMLAGQRPFAAKNLVGILTKHLYEAPPRLPEKLNVPQSLESVIMRALAKEPQDRQANAIELSTEIRAAVR